VGSGDLFDGWRGLDFESVAESVNRHEVLGGGWIGLEFLAEFDDELVEGAGGTEVIDAPDFVEDGIAGDGVAAFAKKQGEHFEFARGEVEGLLATESAEGFAINFDIAESDFCGEIGGVILGFGATEKGVDAGEEFTEAKRFGHVIVGPEF
jgi:hypothetical protein